MCFQVYFVSFFYSFYTNLLIKWRFSWVFLLGLYSWGRFLILFMLYLSIINTYLVFNNIYIYICMYTYIYMYVCIY